MKPRLNVLSVGPNVPTHVAYNVFLVQHSCTLAVADSCRNLPPASLLEDCDVAVLHHTLAPGELRDAACFVRLRWPKARILLIRAEAWCIDDALYDDRIAPGANPEALLTTIGRLADDRMNQFRYSV